MQLLQSTQHEEPVQCPYLADREKRYEYFFAGQVSGSELSRLLNEGWRKFGLYYFRPDCPDCRNCIPLRVPTAAFYPSRSQRRILRKNSGLWPVFGPLKATERIFEIYRDHSWGRFSLESDLDEFLYNFYLSSCPSLQSEFYLEDELIAVGFLDRGEDCLSSVYFCFDTHYSDMNLGTFSVLREIAHARALGLPYYYLGYYVPGCSRMAYKDHFLPREHYDWESRTWKFVTTPPEQQLAR